MKDSTKARLRIILAGWAFIGGMALLMWLVGNSYILAIIGILGFLFLFALWLKYLQDYRGEK
jgi:hypothetical protein